MDVQTAAVPMTVVHQVTPSTWELKQNPEGILKIGDPPGAPLCFVARDADTEPEEFKGVRLRGRPAPARYHDAWNRREVFMGLKTEQEFLSFLNSSGRFSPLDKAERTYGWQMRDFLGCQKLLAELAKHSPESWKEYASDALRSRKAPVSSGMLRAMDLGASYTLQFNWRQTEKMKWKDARFIAVISTRDTLSAMLATIEIDHLRGAKFDICARRDCGRFYEITSHHKRKYCGHACAHLAGMRKRRRAAKGNRRRQ